MFFFRLENKILEAGPDLIFSRTSWPSELRVWIKPTLPSIHAWRRARAQPPPWTRPPCKHKGMLISYLRSPGRAMCTRRVPSQTVFLPEAEKHAGQSTPRGVSFSPRGLTISLQPSSSSSSSSTRTLPPSVSAAHALMDQMTSKDRWRLQREPFRIKAAPVCRLMLPIQEVLLIFDQKFNKFFISFRWWDYWSFLFGFLHI